MYVQRGFAMANDESIALLTKIGAADIVTQSGDGLLSTYMPFVYDPAVGPNGALLTHMMRINPQWRDVRGQAMVLVHGLDHHVTSDWLPAGDAIGTWNYETVHVYGEIVVHDDVEWVRDIVTRTVEKYETTWRVQDSGEEIEGALRALVGIEIRIDHLLGKAKLSQNRHPDVIESIIAGLEAKGLTADADLLRTRSLDVARTRQDYIDEVDARHRAAKRQG